MLKRLAGFTLAASLAFLGSPAVAAEPTTDSADAGAGWLARQMVDGERFEAVFNNVSYPDHGLTIETIWALDAAGAASGNADKAIAWLKKPDVQNAYTATFGGAGSTAKLLLAAQVHGADPANFGGNNLPVKLLARMAENGRFTSTSYPEYDNAFGQAYAVLGLNRTAAGAPAKAIDFLIGTQCTDGGFPLYFDKPTCTSELDGTTVVIQALLATGKTAAADKAITWLLGKQETNGAFPSGPNLTPNANGTGLAIAALRKAGKTDAVDKGKAYLLTLQVGCSGAADDRGAFAYDSAGYDASTAKRATGAAIFGISGAGLADLTKGEGTADIPVLKCETPPAGQLPVTGTQIWVIVAAGLLLVAAGAVTVAVGRRRA